MTVELDERTHSLLVEAAKVLGWSPSAVTGMLVREALGTFDRRTWPSLRRALDRAVKAERAACGREAKARALRQRLAGVMDALLLGERAFRLGEADGQRLYSDAIKGVLREARKMLNRRTG